MSFLSNIRSSFSGLLVVVLAVGLCPLPAYAQEQPDALMAGQSAVTGQGETNPPDDLGYYDWIQRETVFASEDGTEPVKAEFEIYYTNYQLEEGKDYVISNFDYYGFNPNGYYWLTRYQPSGDGKLEWYYVSSSSDENPAPLIETVTAPAKAGCYAANLEGLGKLAGTQLRASFHVSDPYDLGQAEAEITHDNLYTGEAIYPITSVSINGVALREGADYQIGYYVSNWDDEMTPVDSCIDIGEYWYQLAPGSNGKYINRGSGTYYGFEIVEKLRSYIWIEDQAKSYTGEPLSYSGKVSKSGSTGAVSYAYYKDAACKEAVAAKDVKDAGTYYVKATLAADNNYESWISNTAKFTISRAKVSAPEAIGGLNYTGKTQVGVEGGAGYTVQNGSAKDAGDYTAIVTPDKNHAWLDGSITAKTVKWTIAKAANPMSVSPKTAKVSKSKKAKTLAVSKVLKASKAQGTVTYKKLSGNKKITINGKTGKVKVKGGLKKKTYKVKVRVTAAGNENYKSGYKDVTFRIKVK